MNKWTKFKDSYPSRETIVVGNNKIEGSRIIVKYPSGIEAFGIWGTTFKKDVSPEAKWFELPEIQD